MLVGLFYQQLIAPVLGQHCKSYYFEIDKDAMEVEKARAAKLGNVPFVSTNDVVMSWFFQTSCCDHAFMTINFRNRLKGHSNLHAGNYFNHLLFQQEDVASAALIRRAVQTCRRAVTVPNMPSFTNALLGYKAEGNK